MNVINNFKLIKSFQLFLKITRTGIQDKKLILSELFYPREKHVIYPMYVYSCIKTLHIGTFN